MAGKQNAINIKGRSVVASGTLNVENMTLEAEEFTTPVSIKTLLEKVGLDGQFVKVTFVEPDTPISEGDLEE
jgi:hypothetical protein